MKKATWQKAAVSGAAAIGVLGFASPAAFAWSGNSSSGNNYGSSYKQISSMQCYRMENEYNSRSDWNSDWGNDCRSMMMNGNSYYRTSSYSSTSNNYGSSQSNNTGTNNCDRNSNSYGGSEASYNNN